ncbi:MAG: class I SAM-dependent methyltransferase [Bacteroidota bacterium]|nr:class I SAM-dependent methyltransferase [Bacteroidota bacterium]MDP4233872.1 class I SAM-dependent methyltransferase [Bacteroidota bacterium]MDP4243545.1 class I SAM-dependent methyltransferase [Bacteroidota bacterium]MDP4288916.1 class I SAM-dependent methyltransferase [Bacteroidota bacterium]
MHPDIEQQIESFVAFLPEIEQMPLAAFEAELHAKLNAIVAMSDNYPQQREAFRQSLLDKTDGEIQKGLMNRQMRQKPFGYAGDFRVIDWMYKHIRDVDILSGFWDDFCHRQAAAESVRNRKEHLKTTLAEIVLKKRGPVRVLDFASGPCRDVAEAIETAGGACHGSTFHCVDMEPKAIEYAQKVTNPYAKLVHFKWECGNVFRFRSEEQFDLVWCAGLFDYLNDKLAIALIARMWNLTAPGGRIVVGNFHPSNPTRNYIEWCMDWVLIHRTEDELRALGLAAGIPADRISIDREPLGVCIFLTASKEKVA